MLLERALIQKRITDERDARLELAARQVDGRLK